jgi:Holliday junction resolvase RusA-like endonuclease
MTAAIIAPITTQAPDVVFYVPGKPVSVNRMYANGRNGKKYLTAAADAWETLVAYISRSACAELRADIRRGAVALPLRIRCTFYGTRCDADNLLKTTLDGLKVGLGIDDKHFSPVEAVKAIKVVGHYLDGCQIEIWAARDPQVEAAIARGIEQGVQRIRQKEKVSK